MTNSIRKTFLTATFFAASIAVVSAQSTLVDKIEPSADGLTIPYSKYKLPNGLVVMVNEDHSDPVATVMITYKVGSDRESIGKSGFAHFFEHMMFGGSKHLADKQHFRMISAAGGNMNGNTTEDRTQYFNNIPSNQVEVALWLEADRMGYLLDSLTQKKFEIQRSTVKNEKNQNQVNQPYGMIEEFMGQTLYPYGHPYSWPTIGYVDDLDRESLADLKNFFLRWYGPNNAILTISGDVDSKQVMTWVEKYFGNIKQGPEVKKMRVAPVTLASDKYFSYKDKVYLPLTYRVYPTVPKFHKDEPALDVLAEMMGGGNNSIFYKNFVKTERAAQVEIGNQTKELSGEFEIAVFPYPPDEAFEDYTAYDKMFKLTEDSIKSTLNQFEKTGITDEALQRVKAKLEAQIVGGAESTYAKAAILSEWEMVLGRPFNIKDELDRYTKVSKEDVIRVFNKYIKGAGAGVVNVYPRISDKDSVKSNNPNAGMVLKEEPEYAGLTFVPLSDTPDRWKKPDPQAPKVAKVPEYYTSQLKNGLKIIGTKTSETPTIEILLTIDGGNLILNSDELKKNGIAELTADLLNEGTKNFTTEQISAELDKLGATLTFTADKTTSRVTVSCLKKNLDATLKLFEEKLLRPRFDEKDFKRVKKQLKENLAQQKSNADYVASAAFSSVLYGNSIWGLNPVKKNIEKLELAQVKSYYDKFYSPSVARLVIVGDVDQAEILPKLNFLNNWQAKDVKINSAVSTSEVDPVVYVVDKMGAPSSVVRIGSPSIPYDATGEYFKNSVANFMLGGNFNSRLNLNLREDKGYTYGINSGFRADKYKGTFVIGAAVKRKETGNSMSEIMKEVQNYMKNGVTDADVEFTKSCILNQDAMKYETNNNKANFLGKILEFNLSKDFPAQQAQVLKAMTKEDFNNQIKKAIDPTKTAIVIVGDKVAIKKQLESLNINVKDFNEKLNLKKFKEVEVD
jgi:zinc protease